MFGLEFLFGPVLWALPLAATPVVLHLLFRRKSPVVLFSTLRFIRSSVQHTAARKRVQRWMLLATRILLLLILIWVLAQPSKKASGQWLTSGESTIAAIVVDTSYSMEFREGQTSLLERADSAVQDLLRNPGLPLKSANIAVFTSQPVNWNLDPSGTVSAARWVRGDRFEHLMPAAEVLGKWTPLRPTPSPVPLADRVQTASEFLQRSKASQKWLIVITDLQQKEFSHPLPPLESGRLVLIDLHPDQPRSVTVSKVSIQPEQPVPGIRSEAAVAITGRAEDSAVMLYLKAIMGDTDLQPPQGPEMARIDAGTTQVGSVLVRFPVQMPAEPWVELVGELQRESPLPWAKRRAQLIEVPPRRIVTLFQSPEQSQRHRPLKLALDPLEGKSTLWPLDLHTGVDLTGKESVAVVPLHEWPGELAASRLRDFARNGGEVVLLLQPGLEESWTRLPPVQQAVLKEILAGIPSATAPPSGDYHASASSAAAQHDPLLEGLLDEKFQLNQMIARRFVPLVTDATQGVTPVVTLNRSTPVIGSRSMPFLLRRSVGSGIIYTVATLPESRYSNLATHPLFLPLMVRMCLKPPALFAARNVEIGQPLVLAGPEYAQYSVLELQEPGGNPPIQIRPREGRDGRRFEFHDALIPGLYLWREPGKSAIVAMTNVQFPSSETELAYIDAQRVVPGDAMTGVTVARSVGELTGKLQQASAPEPRWPMFLAGVMFLMCIEALMGSIPRLRLNFWAPVPE